MPTTTATELAQLGGVITVDNGNVGVGTASPAQKLEVAGSVPAIKISATSNAAAQLLFNSNLSGTQKDTGSIIYGNDENLTFRTASTERLRIDSSGNVIITSNKALISRGGSGRSGNSAVGEGALQANTTGDGNTASGYIALYSNTTGVNNTASGYQALQSNTTGYNNTASGYVALFSNTTGYNNTASGVNALYSNTTGYNNTASGYQALFSNTTGFSNTASGYVPLYYNTTGYYNTAIGYAPLYSNTTGSQNTASGLQALYSNTTGVNNTASGFQALYSNTTGAGNTANGYNAGYGLGTYSNTTGANNTFIGNESVGASATANNVVTLGNGSIATLRCQVTSITSLSDKRDKQDIENLSAGLDFVGKLRPVSFVWNTRDKAKINIPDAGFIAQELLDVQETTGITIPNLVSQENPEKLEAAYGTLIPVLVQAIKELKAKVELLEEKNK
jgi:hypothetical protein